MKVGENGRKWMKIALQKRFTFKRENMEFSSRQCKVFFKDV